MLLIGIKFEFLFFVNPYKKGPEINSFIRDRKFDRFETPKIFYRGLSNCKSQIDCILKKLLNAKKVNIKAAKKYKEIRKF